MKKSTWILLGIVVALAAIYYGTKQERVSVGVKKLKLPIFAKDKVDKIEIFGKEKVILEKKDNKWFLDIGKEDSPKKVLADPAHIDSMLDAALALKHSYYVTELTEKLEDLGLSEDKKTAIKIYSGDKTLWALDLGKPAESSGRFVKTPDDNAIYAASGSFWQLTRNGLSDFRDKNLMAVSEENAVLFKFLEKGVVKVSIVKSLDDKKEWSLANDQPSLSKDFRVKPEALLSLVKGITTLRASSFKDEPVELLSHNYEAIVKDKDGNIKKVYFYEATDEKYLAKKEDDPQVFEISKYAFERINKSLDDLRDLSLLKIDPNDVQKLSINAISGLIKLEKKDGSWTLLAKTPKDFIFDADAVNDRLTALQSLSGKRIAQPKDLPKNPQWQEKFLVELEGKDGKRTHLFVGELKQDKDLYLAKGNIDDKIYIIPKIALEPFLRGIESFRKIEPQMPHVNEKTPGFESLPPDVQKKLMDAMKKKE